VLLELQNIEKKYAYPSGKGYLTVLKNISLQVSKGESIAIVGPSGSGKSTLLNIMGALDKPTSGTILLDGENLVQLDEKKVATIRNKKLGFIFQLHHLLPQCTVLENVMIPTLTSSSIADRKYLENKAKQLLERVGLHTHLHYRPAQLSGGELQRVAVVRALINQPQLVLADEPTGSLDQQTAKNLGRLLVEINEEEGATLILVTHSSKLAGRMKTVYNLSDGKLQKV